MKPSNKEIEEWIKKTAGADVFSLVKILKNKKTVSEVKLTEYYNKELNVVRGLLYKLYNFNLAFFVKKQNKSTGWYDYYWGLNMKEMESKVINFKKKEFENLKRELKKEEGKRFYICINNCMRLEFKDACENKFKCPECNGLMDYKVNNEKINNLIQKIEMAKNAI